MRPLQVEELLVHHHKQQLLRLGPEACLVCKVDGLSKMLHRGGWLQQVLVECGQRQRQRPPVIARCRHAPASPACRLLLRSMGRHLLPQDCEQHCRHVRHDTTVRRQWLVDDRGAA